MIYTHRVGILLYIFSKLPIKNNLEMKNTQIFHKMKQKNKN